MRTRRSPRNQERLWRELGNLPVRKPAASIQPRTEEEIDREYVPDAM